MDYVSEKCGRILKKFTNKLIYYTVVLECVETNN